MRKNDRSLGNCVQIASKPKPAEILEKRSVKQRLPFSAHNRRQVAQFRFVKMEVLQVLNCRRQAASNGEPSMKRRRPESQVKGGLPAVNARSPIPIGHGK